MGWTIRLIAFGAILLLLAIGPALSPALAQGADVAAAQKRFQDLYAAGNYTAALAEAQKTEEAARRISTDNFAYVSALNDLGRANQVLGQYAQAAEMFERVVGTFKKHLPANHRDLAQPLANLATVYLLQGENSKAEALFKQALEITQKTLGPSNARVAVLINDLGNVYKNQARYKEAEQQFDRALRMARATAGPDSLQVALVLNNLTKVYEDQSRFAEVETAGKRALAIRERILGPQHPDVAASLNNLAHVYERLGRYAEADALYLRVVDIWEKTLGPKHPNLATALLNLASVYASEDRLDEAEALYNRALDIREQVFGSDHLSVATVLNNLAQIYELEGRYDDVESFARRALAIVLKSLGPNHPDTAKVHRKIGVALEANEQYAEADAEYKLALDIFTKALGPNHRFLATVLINQGQLYARQRRYDEADQAYQRAFKINERSRGANHPDTARTLNELATLNLARDPAKAVAYSRRATASVLAQASLGNPGGRQSGELSGLTYQRADFFVVHVESLAAAARSGALPAPPLGREAFEMAQWASQSAAAAAIQQLLPRFGAHSDKLAELVRQHQDLSAFWRDRDRALIETLSNAAGSDASKVAAIRKQITDTEARLAAISQQLKNEFPDFAALANPQPLKVEDVQKLLRPDEALVSFLSSDQLYVFAMTRERFDWQPVAATRDQVADKVLLLRSGLAVDNADKFDLELAHELYRLLLEPVDAVTKDRSHLIIVPSGSLTALPFHLLITEKPTQLLSQGQDLARDGAILRDAAWLIRRQAVSYLPSVASLRVLSAHAQSAEAPKPMIGFGDPVFDPKGGSAPPEAGQRSARSRGTGSRSAGARGASRSYADYWRGAAIDRAGIAETLAQLPDTAEELKVIAQAVGAPASDLHLGPGASVSAVKLAPLADYRIVYFATHGLVAGDIRGLGEPSLAMSMPLTPTDEDDGLLKASEVAQLKLNADWVVLSACNTIAGNKPGAEALSGLARSFFYAGARSLLVTHWAVETVAAMQLMTTVFSVLKTEPALGRAEAMRRGMLTLLNDRSRDENPFPAIWGPFALIGAGAPR